MKLLDTVKDYYNKAAANKWIRYAVYILLGLAVIFGVYIIFFRNNNYSRLNAGKVYKVKNNPHAVAIDAKYFYTVSNNTVEKYTRKNGKRVVSKKLPFKHMCGGKLVNGDLVVINSPKGHPSDTALVWLNPVTLDLIDIMKLPYMKGKLTWIDWAMDKWWVCDSRKGKHLKETVIYCFNSNWQLEGYWKLPKSVLAAIGEDSLSGGIWFGEYLCVAGRNRAELYLLQMPGDKIHALHAKTVQVCFDGQGFAFERGKGHIYAWGVNDSQVVKCAIDLDEID